MVLDALLQLAASQAIAAVATTVTTNVYDGGPNITPVRRFGDGSPMAVMFNINVAADFTTTDETYEFEIIQSAAANMGTPTIIARIPVIAGATAGLLLTGSILILPIPPNYPTQQYVAAQIVTGGTTPTITFSAWLGPLRFFQELGPSYKSGYFVAT